MRFKLSTLFLSIAVVAVITTSMMNPYSLVLQISQLIVFLILASSILLSIYNSPGPRSFWLGFAICGWLFVYGYSLIASGEPFIDKRLINQGFGALYDTIHPNDLSNTPPVAAVAATGYWDPYSSPAESSVTYSAAPEYWNKKRFLTLGKSFSSLLVALVGGCFSRFLYQRKIRLKTHIEQEL